MNIQAIDLFCGIGGLTHGISKTGISVIAGLDFDETCKYAFSFNNSAKFILADVGNYDSNKLISMYDPSSIKILMGCAPCQPFSKLQKKKQEKSRGTRWGLLYSFLDHIEFVRPEIVSMENVSELTKEEVFNDFKQKLLEMGYHVSVNIVNAADYGVPQRRKRLLFLASLIGPIKLIEPTHIGNYVTVRETIGSLNHISQGDIDDSDYLHRAASLNDINIKRIQASLPGGTWRDWPLELLPECYKKESGVTFASVYGRMSWDQISPTLTTQFNRYGTGRYGHPEQDRAISLREGALLQSFPIDYEFVEGKNYNPTDIARQIGNAVPVRLGEIIGLSILRHLEDLKHE